MLVTERTFAACAERVARANDVVIDLETTGLSPWKGDRLCGVAVEAGGEAMYFPYRHEAGGNLPLDTLPKLLNAARGKTYGGWNFRYDATMLAYEDGDSWISPDTHMRDGIIDLLLLNENEPSFSLENISKKYLGAAPTKEQMDRLLAERFPKIKSAKARKGNLWRLHAAEVEPYACGDVLLPRALAEKCRKPLSDWGLSGLVSEMNAYSLLLARIQKHGILIDRNECARLSRTTEDRKAALLHRIRDHAGPKFNPNSWQQVSKWLGTADAQEDTLLRCGHPQAQLIVDYRKLGKAKSAYYDAILDLMDNDSILHPQLNLTRDPKDKGGTRSGRLSCSGPNFQALPHADADPNAIYRVRDLVIARPRMKLAKLDYQRAEMWVGAHYSKDTSLFQAYHSGRDLYTELAARSGIARQDAKILWLMIQYGAGVWKIMQEFGWDTLTAERVRDDFFDLCPGIRKAMYAYADAARGMGCIRLWTGRVCHFDRGEDGEIKKAYAAWNRLVQGAVGEMIRLAMVEMEAPLSQYGARIILQVHDELLIEYPEVAERPVLAIATGIMTDFPQFKLRPRVEPKTGYNYAKMEDYKEAT